jgi:hypothetical protein
LNLLSYNPDYGGSQLRAEIRTDAERQLKVHGPSNHAHPVNTQGHQI